MEELWELVQRVILGQGMNWGRPTFYDSWWVIEPLTIMLEIGDHDIAVEFGIVLLYLVPTMS